MSEVLNVEIEAISDIVCPWCAVGEKRLERAIALTPNIPVVVRRRPFFLAPYLPREGMSRVEFVLQHFGSMEIYLRTLDELVEACDGEGIEFNPDLIRWQPNTLDCHRLIYWAGLWSGAAAATRVEQRLMAMFMAEGADLSKIDLLVEAAAECGIDAAHVRRCLNSDMDEGTVRALARGAHITANNGVPAYVFNGRYGVVGAQLPTYLARFTQVAWTDLNAVPELGF